MYFSMNERENNVTSTQGAMVTINIYLPKDQSAA
jgi:hypothetical protein